MQNSRNDRNRSRKFRLLPVLLATSTLAAATLPGFARAQTVPVEGAVTAGNASITGSGATITVNQTSQRAVIDWASFSVGNGATVNFVQPDSHSATLNRVVSTTPSDIAGTITANGAVYLVNPNGIAITASGVVDTGGGFVASTLGIADGDFMAGKLPFAGNGASAKVSNAGRILASSGAYVALLGGAVANSGTISVPMGRIGLGSGEQVALDINGGEFMQVAVPTRLVTGDQPLIDMSGSIVVTGGRVTVSAASLKDAVRNVVNLSGSITADSATGDGGTIHLLGGDGGLVRASGTLSARALGVSGNGGTIETSGASIDYTGLTIDARAATGTTGTWLIDPTDLVVDAKAAATISANLANANVTLSTTGTLANGPGTQTLGLGDIAVTSAINWSSANVLTLSSWNGITISAAINGSAGGLALIAGTSGAAGAGAIVDTAAINVGLFSLTKGSWSQIGATLPAFNATDFQIAAASATFLRATGGSGAVASPYLIADVYGLQGVASQTLLAKNFALAGAISASGTALWNGGKGWLPIGTDGVNVLSQFGNAGFLGSFDGRGFSITGLTLNRPAIAYAGLFGYLSGSVANVGVENAQFTSGSNAFGILSGYVDRGLVTGSHASGAITGVGAVGGLIGGLIGGTISDSWSSANVVAAGGYSGSLAGGLIGWTNSGTVARVYATGSVNAVGTGGGLIGSTNGGSISQAWASGNVTLTGTNFNIAGGGLIGSTSSNSAVSRSYATGSVVGANAGFMRIGGLIGWMVGGSVATSYATGSVRGSVSSGGGIDGGGLIGAAQSANITQAWASGKISTGSAGFENAAGGLIGNLYASTVTGAYWDSYSTGVDRSVGQSLFSQIAAGAVTSDPAQSGAANSAYRASAYSTFDLASWTVFDGLTRPFGAWEMPAAVDGVTTIINDHQLQLLAKSPGLNARLGADIDLSLTGAAKVGNPASYAGMWSPGGFVPIGGDTLSFTGALDGQGHTIRNLSINTAAPSGGLFGTVGTNGSISNLTLTGAAITVDARNAPAGTAGLLAASNLGKISRVSANGTVTVLGTANTLVTVGGLVASNSGSIIGASVSGAVVASHGRAVIGGLVGNNSGAIEASFSQAAVSGGGDSTEVGGLVGVNVGGTISESYAATTVRTAQRAASAGGLVGTNQDNGLITNSYFNGGIVADLSGSFTGILAIGGLVGSNYGTVAKSYAVATLPQAGTFIGGMAGLSSGGSFSASFWDTTVSGNTNGMGSGSLPGATGLTTASMQNFQSSALQYGGWDFASVWAPPAQAGQAGQTTAFYPTLYATSPVLFIAPTDVTRTYGSSGSVGTVNGGPALYRFGPVGDALAANVLFVTTVTAASPVGTYGYTPISANSVTSAGGVSYRVISAGGQGSITITRAPLMLSYTANAASSTYGAALAALSGNVAASGFVNGDTLASLSGAVGWSTTATPAANAGSYAITGSGLASGNYAITATQAALNASAYTITRAPLMLSYTANAVTLVFGQPFPVFTGLVQVSGLRAADTLTGVTSGIVEFTAPAAPRSVPGTYALQGEGLSANSNYVLTSVQAPANLTAMVIIPFGQTLNNFSGGEAPPINAESQIPRSAERFCDGEPISRALREGSTAPIGAQACTVQ
jgi:filamentous hemagglutinin family protein